MASNPIPPAATEPLERSLSQDQWWDLFDQLRLSQQADYAEVGGPVVFLRRERDADISAG